MANFQAVPDYHYYYKTVSATNGGYREAKVRQFRTTSQQYQKAVENIQLVLFFFQTTLAKKNKIKSLY